MLSSASIRLRTGHRCDWWRLTRLTQWLTKLHDGLQWLAVAYKLSAGVEQVESAARVALNAVQVCDRQIDKPVGDVARDAASFTA